MKEIIYLDIQLVNSYLAQLDEGLTKKMIASLATQLTEGETKGKDMSSNVQAGVKPFFEVGTNQKNIEKQDVVYSKTNSDLLETALDDYSLEVLLEKLETSKKINYITNKKNYNEGEIINVKSDFFIVDFNRLEYTTTRDVINLMDSSGLHNEKINNEISLLEDSKKGKSSQSKTVISQEINKLKKDIKKETIDYTNFGFANRFGKFGSTLFPNSKIIKTDNIIMICHKDNLRLNEENLNLYNLSNRKINILGIVLSKSDDRTKIKDDYQLPIEVIASSSPLYMMDIVLTSLKILNEGDYYVRPISVYFDSND